MAMAGGTTRAGWAKRWPRCGPGWRAGS